jgi:multidrug efflux pump subunit AcrA (membrane-fusion protein)
MPLKKLYKLCLFVVLVTTLAACSATAQSGPTPTPLPPLVSYQSAIYTVEKGSIVSEVKVLGSVVPTKQDDLFFRSSGFVSRVLVKVGDVLKKGDLLAEQQTSDALNQLQQAQIDLAVAQAALVKDVAQAQHEVKIAQLQVSLAALDATDTRGQINLQIAQENLAMAQISAKQVSDPSSYDQQSVARSQLAVQRLQGIVADEQIVAPYDCVVMESRAKAGQSADAFSVQFTVGDPSQLVVQVASTTDLSTNLTVNSQITLHPVADAPEGYATTYLPSFLPISSSAASETSSSSDSFYFAVPPEETGKLLVGRQVQLEVVLGKKDNVLLLPPAAIRNYRGINYVIVLDGAKERRVDLYSIGLETTERWEVNGPLNEGDKVLGP